MHPERKAMVAIYSPPFHEPERRQLLDRDRMIQHSALIDIRIPRDVHHRPASRRAGEGGCP